MDEKPTWEATKGTGRFVTEIPLRLSDGAHQSLSPPVLGGARVPKKVKLAVLQFYKVDDATGKVSRLRKECPNAECGAGTFMANHFDRHYCGKCGLTYVYQKAQVSDLIGAVEFSDLNYIAIDAWFLTPMQCGREEYGS
ncbi:hypothetical protein C4D60_Mb01t26850 [Musa balbisiana]|uniref:Small ribosomal subunit protein eS31 domain-containing protein n=1 Tax=Musa balbisiana TaxID=52838 RepID=A0A4V4H7P1_MUSBA|nr:hypothetical protein C4D60_Mb01t26850 [Musa balbisiana]